MVSREKIPRTSRPTTFWISNSSFPKIAPDVTAKTAVEARQSLSLIRSIWLLPAIEQFETLSLMASTGPPCLRSPRAPADCLRRNKSMY